MCQLRLEGRTRKVRVMAGTGRIDADPNIDATA